MPKRMERFKSRLKQSAVVSAKPKEKAKFSPDGRKGLASIKTAMAFGTKNPPPKKKKKKGGWLMGGKTGWDMLEQMEREAQGAPVPKSEQRKKKGK